MIPHSRPLHGAADEEAARATLRSQRTADGEHCRLFAEVLREHFNARSVILTASGTLALWTALRVAGVGAGDDVIVPTYVCPEVLDAVLYAGANPILCDIDPATYAPSSETIDAAWTPRAVTAVIAHLFGIPASVDDIRRSGRIVVDDVAQGLGAFTNGRPVGGFGTVAALSFKAIKMLSCGEGGAVVVHDETAAARLGHLAARRDPRQPRFEFPLSNLSAAVAFAQWQRLADFLDRRRHLAERYRTGLEALTAQGYRLPGPLPGCAWFRFPVRLPPRLAPQTVIDRMAEEGVAVRRPVDCLLHRLLGEPSSRYPCAEAVFESTVSLPIYPALTDAEQDRVVEKFLESARTA